MITVAGTSCGGSSYMARIVKALYGKRYLVVVITEGAKQKEVANSIKDCVKYLNLLIKQQGGQPVIVEVKLK